MNRRTFLRSSAHGAALLALPALVGCKVESARRDSTSDDTTHDDAEVEFDPGPYSVNDRWLVFDEEGAAYELDPEGHTVRHADGSSVHGRFEGSNSFDELNHPSDGALGSDGHLYVLDRGNLRVRVLDKSGNIVSTIGERELKSARDLALHDGSVYVCDATAHRIVRFSIAGAVEEVFMSAPGGQLNGPRSVAIDSDGDVHVLDPGRAQVVVLGDDGQVQGTYGEYGDDAGTFVLPTSVACDSKGRSFVSDIGSGYVNAFDANGDYLGRFRPRDAEGQIVAPERVTVLADDTLHISTGGHTAFQDG